MRYHAFITRPAALEIAKEILTKQKGDRFEALSGILEDFRVALDRDKEANYLIIPHAKCRTCGGVVLKQVHVFSRVTCGGNPVVGCPVCNTFSSGEMLSCREDIERTHGNEETVSAEDAADIVIQNLKKKGFDVVSRESIVADLKAIREREKTEAAPAKKRRYNYYRSGRHVATTKERTCFPAAGPSKRREQLHLTKSRAPVLAPEMHGIPSITNTKDVGMFRKEHGKLVD